MSIQLADDHPLALELISLRQTAARFEHEAHSAAVRLQRHSLETSYATDRVHTLERENARLTEELSLLRAHPDTIPHTATIQVQELTLALRRASEKLDAIENTLSERTVQLTAARNDLVKAKHETEGAHDLAAQARAREDEGRMREREMEGRIRAAEKERDMADLVVQEYADLVRSLEGRRSAHANGHAKVPSTGSGTESANGSASTVTLVDGLQEGKHGLHKLLGEFNGETEKLEGVITNLSRDVTKLQVELEAERKASAYTHSQLSEARVELDKLRADDNTAAKMVSRYMKFSQSTSNSLQTAMDAQRARYTATADTLTLRLAETQQTLEHERRQATRLRDVMDELCYDVARETYGRRREVSLRLALLAREEGLAEGTRRWVRRAKEVLERTRPSVGAEGNEEQVGDGDDGGDVDAGQVFDAFMGVILEAEEFVFRLDGELEWEGASRPDGTMSTTEDEDDEPIGTQARMIAARDAVAELSEELYTETQKRLELTREVAELLTALPDRIPRAARRMVDKSTNVISVLRAVKIPKPAPLSEEEPSAIPEESTTRTPADVARDDQSSPILTGIPQLTQEVSETSPVTKPNDSSDPTTPAVLPSDTSEHTTSTLLSPAEVHVPHQDDTLISDTPEKYPLIQDDIDLSSRPPSPSSLPQLDDAILSETPALAFDTSQPSSPMALSELNSESTKPSTQPSNPLLASLAQTKTRYDALQRAFRDCHLALQDLKATFASASPSPSSSSSPPSFISTALERLDDFSEDARVELEIRISDEELIAKGFETLFSIPGALSTHQEREETEAKARTFIDGSDDAVKGAMKKFGGKLDDLQHDIACLKRAVHELPPPSPADGGTEKQSGGWATWTAGLLGASTHAPGRPHSPTFGSVMTSPRLRHASSVGQLHHTSAAAAGHGASPAPGEDPYTALGLRIPMPVRVAPPPSSTSHMHGPGGFGLGLNLGAGPPGQRQRTTSTVYGLGLGARSSPFVLGHSPSPARGSPTKGTPSPGAGSGLGMGKRSLGGPMARRVSSASMLSGVSTVSTARSVSAMGTPGWRDAGVEETSDVE